MKWPLSTLLSVAVLVSSCAATPIPPSPTVKVIEQTKHSIVRLLHEIEPNRYYICTGILVDPTHIVTADHCVFQDVSANGIPIRLVKQSGNLALFESDVPLGVPAQIRNEPLHMGEEVVGIGYGLGTLQAFVRHVALPLDVTEVAIDGLMLRGMSGGPVVDLEGKVVGVIQRTTEDTVTIISGQDELKNFLKLK